MRYKLREIKDGTGFATDAMFEQVEDYNGWTNRETWAVALHINNDQGWQESVHEALRNALPVVQEADNGPDAPFLATWEAGEIIRANVEDAFDWEQYHNGESATRGYGDHYSIPSGLLGAREDIGSLYRVNWDELGGAFLADLAES